MLHIRKLPNEATETEIIALGLPFGKVTNILTLKGKNQVKHTRIQPHLWWLVPSGQSVCWVLTVALCVQTC